ncbi:MarR family winged helix-turn-helix transcriptional regulator [Virgisporangium aurantiacum]|uniref:MarR family transcriptional regulator n=1 Tax=Virgisporangium aurantiacum TaxID=175570 RepID=A0A8J4E082_9ACTN|nr:MarR family transcriptional regulator [Virgisporangium aurantiacum]GIJ56709.1 MarR family transcriptional regulator [Virgisporangium aurantiacum]
MKNGSVILELQRATHATLQRLAADLAGLGLAASDINALGNLADGTARTVSELGTAVGTKPATMTGVLDRLEGRGLITRAARPGDRRAVVVQLTRDGVKAATQVRRAMDDLERRALADLPAGTLDGARAVLRALAEVE